MQVLLEKMIKKNAETIHSKIEKAPITTTE